MLFLSCGGTQVFLSSGDGYVGELLSGIKGFKDPFEAEEGRWDFSQTPQLKRSSSCVK